MNEIVNKVAESGLVTLDLETYFPKDEIRVFDLKDHLFMGLILKEKEFREALKEHNWEQYRDTHVGIVCSADAIIPVWAYMLVTTYLQPVASSIVTGGEEEVRKQLFLKNLSAIDPSAFADKRVVIKGCGDTPIGEFAYTAITNLLLPVARTIMYGEPCSTVPIFKRK